MKKMQGFRYQGNKGVLAVLPIVELTGQERLLIENHQGVVSYSVKKIAVKVCYGCVIVTGDDLRLMEMSRVKLAVCGRIDGLQILGR